MDSVICDLRISIRTTLRLLVQSWFAIVFVLPAAFADTPTAGEDSPTATASSWKAVTLARLTEELQELESQSWEAKELKARTDWLAHWNPDQQIFFDANKKPELRNPWLVQEPNLQDRLERSVEQLQNRGLLNTLTEIAQQQMVIHKLDAPKVRKLNLVSTAEACERLLASLSQMRRNHPKFQAYGFVSADDLYWLELHIRYRLGRALGYRELPDVIERLPIGDFSEYDKSLRQAYQELLDHAERHRPEFVLLDVRMLRRDKQFGRALRVLEEHRWAMEDRWYLKKRRDILRSLQWGPPAEQAARAYEKLLNQLGLTE